MLNVFLFSYFNREIFRLNKIKNFVKLKKLKILLKKIKNVLLLCDKGGENVKDDWILLLWISVLFDGLKMFEWTIKIYNS